MTEPDPEFEALLALPEGDPRVRLHRVQAGQPDAAGRSAAWQTSDPRLRRVPGLPRGAPRGVHRAVQHDPDQRHRLLPRPGRLGPTCAASVLPALLSTRPDGADPGLERRLRLRRGGVHPGHAPGRGARASRSSATGSRSTPPTSTRRRSPRPGRPTYDRQGARGGARPSCVEKYFEPVGNRFAFRKELRRSVIFGRNDLVQDAPDLPDRPAGLPQHADVLQRRDAGPDPRPVPLRAARRTASCSWARPRCCSATAALFRPWTSSGGSSARSPGPPRTRRCLAGDAGPDAGARRRPG